MKSQLRTKIVATIGPSTWDDQVLTEMIQNGFAAARINASFADFAEMERVASQLRRLSPRVTLILDTMGHKIRVTGFEQDQNLTKGDEVILASDTFKVRGKNVIKVTYPTLARDLTRGVKILIDDGNITLQVKDIQNPKVICEVLQGGILKKRKTVNIPGVHLDFPSLSEKDEKDIRNAIKLNYDIISASFIRNTEDIALIRKAIGDADLKLIAKIEDYEGVKNFDEILQAVDGIMIARGDLGVEIPMAEVPILQKTFIYKCRQAGKPVIVATQMLESMRENNRPTRAEVSDVSNAVMDGADALMLSAETSTGKHPVEAVRAMSDIAKEAEKVLIPQILTTRTDASESTDAICRHVFQLAKELNLRGIIVPSISGKTVASLARHRLDIPIWAISNNPRLIRQLQLFRGVKGFYVQDFKHDRDAMIEQSVSIVYGNGNLEYDDKIAVVSGSTIKGKQTNSILEIIEVRKVIERL